jgi:hypothetical protein
VWPPVDLAQPVRVAAPGVARGGTAACVVWLCPGLGCGSPPGGRRDAAPRAYPAQRQQFWWLIDVGEALAHELAIAAIDRQGDV